MKKILPLLAIILTLNAHSQSQKGWQRIYYLFDKNQEVAKRICSDSVWVIDGDPKVALEKMFIEKEKADKRYELALAILKLLNPNGTPIDQLRYNAAILAYNTYLQNNK